MHTHMHTPKHGWFGIPLLIGSLACGGSPTASLAPSPAPDPNHPAPHSWAYPAFQTLGAISGCLEASHLLGGLRLSVEVTDAGDGITGFNTLIAHSPAAGACGPTFLAAQHDTLAPVSGPTAYPADGHGTTTFVWTTWLTEPCGEWFLVVSAAPTGVHVIDQAISYATGC